MTAENQAGRILEHWEVFGLPEPSYGQEDQEDNVSLIVMERPDIAKAAKKFGMAGLTNTERFDIIFDMTVVAETAKGGINRIFDPKHRLFDSPFSRFARYVWGTEARDWGDKFTEEMLIKAEARHASLLKDRR